MRYIFLSVKPHLVPHRYRVKCVMAFRIIESGKVLRIFVHTMYGIPPCWPRTGRRSWCFMALSVLLVILQWSAFCFDMYCVKVYWRGDRKPNIPNETLLLLISLNLSGACSFTLALSYFYNTKNRFHLSSSKLIPKFDFQPREHVQQDDVSITLTTKDWLYTHLFMFVGLSIVALVMFCAFALNVFFDFYGLHNFTAHIAGLDKVLYFCSVVVIYWGFVSSVVACCIFHILSRDVVEHIRYTEHCIINDAKDFITARGYHECLLLYTDKIVSSFKPWFIVHNMFFIFIVLVTFVEWMIALTDNHTGISHIWLAQIAGSLLIAFKFAFPFISASRVTSKFEEMHARFNRECNIQEFPELDEFLSYCKRCNSGFKVCGIKITGNLALVLVLSCFVGFFKLYKAIV